MKFKLEDIFKNIINSVEGLQKEMVNSGWKEASEQLKTDIVKTVKRGQSPIQKQERFAEYSPSYKNAMGKGKLSGKKPRPVNLTLTGEMLNSVTAKKNEKGFDLNFNKTVNGKNLAEIHSFEGAGKSKTIRQILPKEGEQYKDSVMYKTKKILIEVANKSLEKLFRRFK